MKLRLLAVILCACLGGSAFRHSLPLGLEILGKFGPGGAVAPRGIRSQIGRCCDDGHGAGLPWFWFRLNPPAGRDGLNVST